MANTKVPPGFVSMVKIPDKNFIPPFKGINNNIPTQKGMRGYNKQVPNTQGVLPGRRATRKV